MIMTTIGEAFEINPKVSIRKGEPVPFLSMGRLVAGQRNVFAEEERPFKGGSKFNHGDTLMARITPCLENKKIARYYSVNPKTPASGSTEFIVIRGKKGVTTNPFAYYFAISPDVHQLAISLMTGTSGRQRVEINAFKESEVVIPDLDSQIKITHLLGAFDDKIEANKKVINRADELRSALWKKLIKADVEKIPMSSLAEYINGGAFTKGAGGSGRVVVRISELNSGIGKSTVYSDIDVDPKNVAYPGDLLFAWSGTLMTKRWAYDEAIINQHIFKVIPKAKFDLWSLELIVNSQMDYFRAVAAGKATTMGHIKRSDLDQNVIVPKKLPENVQKIGKKLWNIASQFEIENQVLSKTRDELLPLLMSGKITVKDAAGAAAEVGVAKRKLEENV